MEISIPKNYTLITSTENSFEAFYTAFIHQHLHTVNNHKVVQLSENLNTTVQNLLLFLNVANEHKNNGMSFVIICNGIDIDEISEEINIVPTILEAEDILEMEAIERDLGF